MRVELIISSFLTKLYTRLAPHQYGPRSKTFYDGVEDLVTKMITFQKSNYMDRSVE